MTQTNNLIQIQYYKTPYAEFIMGAYKGELCMLDYRYRKMRDAVDSRLKRLLKADYVEVEEGSTEVPVFEQSKLQLDEYFLVTPVEKVKIEVDDAPFVLTQWHWLDEKETVMRVRTNLDDEFILDEEHPLIVNKNGDLYVTVRRNLLAKVHRNVYYQWADIATEKKIENGTELLLNSAGCQFVLGHY